MPLSLEFISPLQLWAICVQPTHMSFGNYMHCVRKCFQKCFLLASVQMNFSHLCCFVAAFKSPSAWCHIRLSHRCAWSLYVVPNPESCPSASSLLCPACVLVLGSNGVIPEDTNGSRKRDSPVRKEELGGSQALREDWVGREDLYKASHQLWVGKHSRRILNESIFSVSSSASTSGLALDFQSVDLEDWLAWRST